MTNTNRPLRFGTAVRLFGAGLLAAGVLAVQALAQPGPAKAPGGAKKAGKADAKTRPLVAAVKAPAASVKFSTDGLRTIRKARVTHRAFQRVKPGTKTKIAAGEKLTLPDGRKVDGDEFYTKLDELERKLNDLGHSLH